MPRIQLEEDIKPLSEFRANVASLIDQVRTTKRPIVITQRGKSAAVLINISEYEALLQKIELLTDVQTAEQQMEAGLGIEHSEAKQRLAAGIEK